MTRSEFLYEIISVKQKHHLTVEQVLFLYAKHHGITWPMLDGDAIMNIASKDLMKGAKVDYAKLFGKDDVATQTVLGLEMATKPKCTDDTLRLAHNLESKLVNKEAQTPENLKKVADKFFKGDMEVARYYNVFRSLFPIRELSPKALWNNNKWVSLFCVDYDGMTMWVDAQATAKIFHKIYLTRDIGIFLSGTFHWVADSINVDECTAFVSKPNKYLKSYEAWYDLAKGKFDEAQARKSVKKKTNTNKPVKAGNRL